MQAGLRPKPKDLLPRSLARQSTPVCVLSSLLYESSLDKALAIYPAALQQWCTWPCCDVCAYSLNVSHLVVTQASRLAVRCRERPLMRLVTACPPPHVVASEKPVKFPALY